MKNRAADSKIRNPTVQCWAVATNVLKVNNLRAIPKQVAQQQYLK